MKKVLKEISRSLSICYLKITLDMIKLIVSTFMPFLKGFLVLIHVWILIAEW